MGSHSRLVWRLYQPVYFCNKPKFVIFEASLQKEIWPKIYMWDDIFEILYGRVSVFDSAEQRVNWVSLDNWNFVLMVKKSLPAWKFSSISAGDKYIYIWALCCNWLKVRTCCSAKFSDLPSAPRWVWGIAGAEEEESWRGDVFIVFVFVFVFVFSLVRWVWGIAGAERAGGVTLDLLIPVICLFFNNYTFWG